MANLLQASLWFFPAAGMCIFLFIKMRQYLNEEWEEKKKALRKNEAKMLLRQSNIRDKYADALRKN